MTKKKEHEVSESDREKYKKMLADLKPQEKKLLRTNKHLTVVNFENKGGAIMPILVQLHFRNGKKESHKIPAEIWKKNHEAVSKLFVTRYPVERVLIDPTEQTADANQENNVWPPQIKEESFTLERKNKSFNNDMKRAREKKAEEDKKKAAEKKKKAAAKKAKEEESKSVLEAKDKKDSEVDKKAEPVK